MLDSSLKKCFIISIFFIHFICFPIFYFGYLPTISYRRRNYDNFHNGNRNEELLTTPVIDKVVLVIIDSMQFRMLLGNEYYWDTLKISNVQNRTIRMRSHIQAPSFSYARVKSLTTGSVSSFKDVLFNLNTQKCHQDNLINLLKIYRNFSIDYYGDTSWTNMFASEFTNYIKLNHNLLVDYNSIDDIITENINKYIDKKIPNWDMLIMHYLGLDHIGHIEGPFGNSICKKIKEMDKIMKRLVNFTMVNHKNSLFILTSDHGMSVLGGHGGVTYEELVTPLVLFSRKLENQTQLPIINITQNDLVPFLSGVLGIPIPYDNVGVVPLKIASKFLNNENIDLLLTNNFKQIIQKVDYNHRKSFQSHFNLIFNKTTNKTPKQREKLYQYLLKLQKEIMPLYVNHNYFAMDCALIICSVALIMCSIVYLEEYIVVDKGLFSCSLTYTSLWSIIVTLLFYQPFQMNFFPSAKFSVCFFILLVTSFSTKLIKDHILRLWFVFKHSSVISKYISASFVMMLISSLYYQIIQQQHSFYYYTVTSIAFVILMVDLTESFNWSCSYTLSKFLNNFHTPENYQNISSNFQQSPKINSLNKVPLQPDEFSTKYASDQSLYCLSATLVDPAAFNLTANNNHSSSESQSSVNMNHMVHQLSPSHTPSLSDRSTPVSLHHSNVSFHARENNVTADLKSPRHLSNSSSYLPNMNNNDQNSYKTSVMFPASKIKNSQQSWSTWSLIRSCSFSVVLFILSDRLCRSINITGELTTDRTSMGLFLIKYENHQYLISSIVISLVILSIMFWFSNTLSRATVLQFYIGINLVFRFLKYFDYIFLSDTVVWFYYAVFGMHLLVSIMSCCARKTISIPILKLSDSILLLNLLVCRPHNISVWTITVFKAILFKHIYVKYIFNISIIHQFILFQIMGWESYFQMGNSNSLSTLDYYPGFVGMLSYIEPVIVCIMMLALLGVHFYWLFLWLEWYFHCRIELNHTYDNNSSILSNNPSTITSMKLLQKRPIVQALIIGSLLVCIIENLTLFCACWFYHNQLVAWYVMSPYLTYQTVYNLIVVLIFFISAPIYFYW